MQNSKLLAQKRVTIIHLVHYFPAFKFDVSPGMIGASFMIDYPLSR